MSTTTKNAQSRSAVLVQDAGLDEARLERALEGCAPSSPAAPGLSAEVIDGALERAAVAVSVGVAVGVPEQHCRTVRRARTRLLRLARRSSPRSCCRVWRRS